MTKPSPLSEQERADLIAYLDGELKGPAAQAIEARLAVDQAVRAEAESLKKTWDLLDFLPRAEPSPSFTNRTLDRLSPIKTGVAPQIPGAGSGATPAPGMAPPALPATTSAPRVPAVVTPSWRRHWVLGVSWAAACVLALVGGFLAVRVIRPWHPGEAELVRELRLIENRKLYELVDDLDFLRELANPDLFGDEPQVGS
jgi:anti-sigma factor RsiW